MYNKRKSNWIMLSSINHDNRFISYYTCWIRMFPLWLLDMHRFQCVHSLLLLMCWCHDHKVSNFEMESTSAKIIKMQTQLTTVLTPNHCIVQICKQLCGIVHLWQDHKTKTDMKVLISNFNMILPL